eukprot:5452043-Amphidinium_carterae.1
MTVAKDVTDRSEQLELCVAVIVEQSQFGSYSLCIYKSSAFQVDGLFWGKMGTLITSSLLGSRSSMMGPCRLCARSWCTGRLRTKRSSQLVSRQKGVRRLSSSQTSLMWRLASRTLRDTPQVVFHHHHPYPASKFGSECAKFEMTTACVYTTVPP